MTPSYTSQDFQLRNLNLLALDGNKMTGGIPESICENMENLQELYLSDNEFEQALHPLTFAECNKLRVVHLERNFFEGVRIFQNVHTHSNLQYSRYSTYIYVDTE